MSDERLCHLRVSAGERGQIRRAAQLLGLDMSKLARDAWAWWEEQD